MSDEPNTESSSDDEATKRAFDEIMSNQSSDSTDEPEAVEIGTLWDGVTYLWPQLNEGVLVKGLILTEYVDDRGKVLKWQTSPDMAPWELKGMLMQALEDLQAENMVDALVAMISDTDEDDEDESDDD